MCYFFFIFVASTVSRNPTVLEDFLTRNVLLDDIMELSEFTKQMINELSAEAGSILQIDLPTAVQAYSSQDIQEMFDNVTIVIEKLTNKKCQQLLLMLGSQRYKYTCIWDAYLIAVGNFIKVWLNNATFVQEKITLACHNHNLTGSYWRNVTPHSVNSNCSY